MSRTINLLGAGAARSAAQGLRHLNENLGGSKSEELTAAAKVLRRVVAKTLSVKGGGRAVSSIRSKRRRVIGGTPSQPGEPPRQQTGQLARSVKEGPVDTGRRVGALRFTAQLLELGVQSVLGQQSVRRSSIPLKVGRRGRARKPRAAARSLTIAARPFMERALAAAQPEMLGVVARIGEARAQKAAG